MCVSVCVCVCVCVCECECVCVYCYKTCMKTNYICIYVDAAFPVYLSMCACVVHSHVFLMSLF